MFQLLDILIKPIQYILVPLCFIVAWTFSLMLVWSFWTTLKETANRTKTMHQIPCSNCQYFTNDHRLKCPVNPHNASTEEAINCRDYHPVTTY
ncbi:MAG: hypothetical protein AAGF26_19490 [Cyanobacteria bacterium P01_G01_bin.49]